MSKQKSSYRSPKEGKVEVEEPTTSDQQIPGYLSVKLSNLPIDEEDVKFYGVSEKGDRPSGRGVEARKVKNLSPDNDQALALFDIEELLKQRQFTDETVECIIKVDDEELGRERFSYLSTVYLG